ncbi:MAG: hypothetical protein IKW99_08320 [Bacteroidales bacterium]|nr:hypothetical protein [Bacteroidales bacterium]
MPRLIHIIILIFALTLPARGQVRGILGLPDRIMSSSRIGRVSAREIPVTPAADTSRIQFPDEGERYISEDYEFFNYLKDNDFRIDAKTLTRGRYAPSDTLDFLRAKVLFSDLKLFQASELFGKVPYDSPFGPESFYYQVVSLSSAGEYDKAYGLLSSLSIQSRFSEGGPYAELTALQAAGLSILRGQEDEWLRHSSSFTFGDYALMESERVISEIGQRRFGGKSKHAGVAALASAVIPGAGKVYAGRLGEGVAAFLTVGSLGAITAENWVRHGNKDWRTILAGSLCATFYLGNIYGSYMSVSIENNDRITAENTAIVYHLHLPLRTVFR